MSNTLHHPCQQLLPLNLPLVPLPPLSSLPLSLAAPLPRRPQRRLPLLLLLLVAQQLELNLRQPSLGVKLAAD